MNFDYELEEVTICMHEDDFKKLVEKAKKTGIPYQMLIKSIIHRYLNGGIILKDAI